MPGWAGLRGEGREGAAAWGGRGARAQAPARLPAEGFPPSPANRLMLIQIGDHEQMGALRLDKLTAVRAKLRCGLCKQAGGGVV